tara:strand:+ start:412 stop:1089 length:678 start_codon:yes stop_codon:yes gene_type:complete
MNWEDEGILLLKRKFRENANIVNIFTKNHGKTSGIIYGGNSRKIKNYLQVGNRIYINHVSKNENRIGYFKTELIEAISPKYFDDKIRTCVLGCLTSLLNSLLPDLQKNEIIYETLNIFIGNLDNKNFIIHYLQWETELIKQLGFELDFKNSHATNIPIKEIIKCTIDNNTYDVPAFIITKDNEHHYSKELIKKGLSFTRNIFLNKIFSVNNTQFPKQRLILENYF